MKSQLLRCRLIPLLAFPLFVYGQNRTLSNITLAQNFSFYQNTDTSLDHQHYFAAMSGKMHLAEASVMKLEAEVEGQGRVIHYKYQQYHAGLPIFGNHYFLHEEAGRIVSASGRYSPQVDQTQRFLLNASAALAKAKMDQKGARYETEHPAVLPCYIDPAFPKTSETVRLAYQIDLSSTAPLSKRRYFVDAQTGKILYQYSLIQKEGVPSTAKTKYYGIQNIITDSLSPQSFVLKDGTRGGGIYVFGPNTQIFTNSSSNWDLSNNLQDEVALDAHYCAQEYFDLLIEDYNWSGLDNHGKAFVVNVHNNGAGAVNAFWDGSSTNFGDGNCIYGPLTTLEVVGHEFTHGVIENTSQLVYNDESGAMNESLADMFGKLLERKTDPAHFSWNLGHSFSLTPSAQPFRVMDDPKSVQMPALYKGEFWLDGNDPHVNSSIGNLWFSMLVDGKQGINEKGVSFDVPALGPEKTGQIVFLTNKAYFIPSSDYSQFYQTSIAAAEELYGAGSLEALAVAEAWKAVGLPSIQAIGFDLAISVDYSASPVCGLNQYHAVTIPITNRGDIAYDPSMGATLTLWAQDLPDKVITLTEPIAPGEVLNIQVDNWLIASTAGYSLITSELELPDSNLFNNSGLKIYQIVAYQSNDLYVATNPNQAACFDTIQNISVYILSNSCETVPSGTLVTLSAEDENGTTFWSTPYTFQDDLPGFGLIYAEYNLPIDILPASGIFNFKINYVDDPDNTNNETYTESSVPALINAAYQNNFNALDNYLEYQHIAFEPIILYQGNYYFGSTGAVQDPGAVNHCEDYTKYFNQGYFNGVNAVIRGCVDFSMFQNTSLEFDLVQFRNLEAVANNDPHSSMLQVNWTGNGNGTAILYDQPAGAVVHHNYSLPAHFKGEILLKLYTEIGDWDLNPANFNVHDFELLDNLRLNASTSTTQLNNPMGVQLSPNPAQDQTFIQSSARLKTLIVQSVNGQLIRQVALDSSNFNLDLKGLSNGVYFLKMEGEHGEWIVRKLVKVD